jgi:non-heme chloroperoxidase
MATTFKTEDGAEHYYKDWGTGQPIVFSHGWPLSADAFEDQMFFMAANGYRAVGFDRRGHGRSQQTWHGNDMDTYADDLAALIETLDLRDAVLVGHSTGGGVVTRYIGKYGTGRVAGAVLISSITPYMLKTGANPGGTPMEVFDRIRGGVTADRSQYWMELSVPFYGFNREGAKVSEGLRQSFWLQSSMTGFPGSHTGTWVWSDTDLTEDLKRFDVPTLVMHGDDDQIVPIADSAPLAAGLVEGAILKVYPGLPHGMCQTHKEQINADLLEFVKTARPKS